MITDVAIAQSWYGGAGWALILSGLMAAGSAVVSLARRMLRRRSLERQDRRRAEYDAALDRWLVGAPSDEPLPLAECTNPMDRALLACLAGRLGGSDEAIRGRLAVLCERLGYLDHFRRRAWSGWATRRAEAAWWLGRLAHRSGVADLVRLLDDPSLRVRSAAITALGMIGEPRALSALLKVLDAIEEASPSRWRAIIGRSPCPIPIGLITHALIGQGASAIFPLLPRLRSGSTSVREVVAEVLSRVPDAHPRVRAALLGALGDGDPEVRARAAKALGHVGYVGAVVPLVQTLGDPMWFVRLQAARALGSLGHVRAIPALVGILTDESWQVRAAAADALRRLGEPAVPALTEYLFSSRDRYAKEQVVEELQRTPFLHEQINALDAVQSGAAFAALRLLREAARHGAIRIVLDAVRRHPRASVRRRLVGMLAPFDSHHVLATLHDAADRDPDAAVREAAHRALTGCRSGLPKRDMAQGHAA